MPLICEFKMVVLRCLSQIFLHVKAKRDVNESRLGFGPTVCHPVTQKFVFLCNGNLILAFGVLVAILSISVYPVVSEFHAFVV